MLGSIPHQKFCFYHLPTRGRAGIKLGDAWYISNVSIIFDCSMLWYYLFWMLMGLFLYFYIIFGTNLLIEGPTQIAVFFLFLCFAEKEYQTEPKRNETFARIVFGTNTSRRLGVQVKEASRWPRGWGHAPPPYWGRPPVSWAPRASPDWLISPIYTLVP